MQDDNNNRNHCVRLCDKKTNHLLGWKELNCSAGGWEEEEQGALVSFIGGANRRENDYLKNYFSSSGEQTNSMDDRPEGEGCEFSDSREWTIVRTDDWLEKANFCATTLQNGLDWLGGWLGGWMEKELDVSIVFVFDIAKASGYSLLLTANWTVLDRWTPYFYVYCCTIASDCLFLTVQVEEMMRNGIDRRRDWILLAEEWRRTFTISPSLAYDSN